MKHQPTEFTVDSLEELNLMVESRDFIFAKSIVEGILATVNTDEPEAYLLAIKVNSENAIYDISVRREDFAETLEQNLPHYIREEEYEECRRIATAIEKLKENNLSTIVTNLIKVKGKNG
jgi:hypothetical protein